jgi:alginate O-acetyltransferase complex protein AlgF
VINAGGQGAVDLQLDGKPFVQAPDASASDYVVTPQGKKQAAWGGKTLPLTLGAGKFYSLVIAGSTPKLMEDPAMQSRAKALVRLYNLSPKPALSLKTADGKVAVIENVPAQDAADRMVNAAKLAFGVFDAGTKLAETAPVSIERGFAYSVLAIGRGDAFRAVWIKSATRAK